MHSEVLADAELLEQLDLESAEAADEQMRMKACLFEAVVDEDLDEVELLLDSGADLEAMDAFGRSVLMKAAAEGKDEVCCASSARSSLHLRRPSP